MLIWNFLVSAKNAFSREANMCRLLVREKSKRVLLGSLILRAAGRIHRYRRALAFPILALLPFTLSPASTAQEAPHTDGPLVVDEDSHVVVLEYEAWFGPNAVTFQGAAAQPLMQSTDMQAVGGGYDSADPAIIKQHVEWMEYMGIDAALIEVTNNVSCIFNSEEFAKKYLQGCTNLFRSENQSIRNNTGNLYPAWSQLGTHLKLIPMLGGIDNDVLFKDTDGKTAFEKEVDYFVSHAATPRSKCDLRGQTPHGDLPGRGARSQRCRQPLVVSTPAIFENPSGDQSKIYVQDDGGISRQSTSALGETGATARTGGNQSAIWILELG